MDFENLPENMKWLLATQPMETVDKVIAARNASEEGLVIDVSVNGVPLENPVKTMDIYLENRLSYYNMDITDEVSRRMNNIKDEAKSFLEIMLEDFTGLLTEKFESIIMEGEE